MKILKKAVKTVSVISLAVLVVTGEPVVAIPVIIFSSMSLGIMLVEKNDGERKYESGK